MKRKSELASEAAILGALVLCALVALVIGGASSAKAGESYGLNVPVGGSIAMPGAATATFTNPAGLVGNRGVRLSLQGASPKPMEDPNYRGLLLAGNGWVGVSAGVDYYSPDTGTKTTDAVYGLAVALAPLNLAVGVAGRSGVKNSTGTNFNAGMLFMPFGMLSIGATAMGVKDEVDSYGAGIALGIFPGVDLVVDAAANSKLKNAAFKPGLKLANQFAGISVSYGTDDTAQFSKSVGAAAYFRLGGNSEIEMVYNHGGDLPKYYASLSLGF